jgi:hypothetical protein
MIPEPGGISRRGRCPCCHAFDARLYPCLGCNWGAAIGRQESKERLEQFSPGSGPNAYNPTGCRVCAACLQQMTVQPLSCPLRVFHDLGPHPSSQASIVARERLTATWTRWERWLGERGWPEITETYWHRLLAFLQAERNSSRE